MTHKATGPYQITDQDLEYHDSLDILDVDAWYILVNGAMNFVDSEHTWRKLIQFVKSLNLEKHT